MQARRMVIGRPWRLTRMVSPSPIEMTVARNSVAGAAAAFSWKALGMLAAIARTSRSCGFRVGGWGYPKAGNEQA